MDTPTGEETTGLNRRSVLKRGAIVSGAMVWTVPAVQTLAAPAFAAGTPCSANFKLEVNGVCIAVIGVASTAACCDCIATRSGDGSAVANALAAAICIGRGSCVLDPTNVKKC